jgi:hypothetical protein
MVLCHFIRLIVISWYDPLIVVKEVLNKNIKNIILQIDYIIAFRLAAVSNPPLCVYKGCRGHQ